MLVVAPVRFVAGGAAQTKCRLMQVRLFELCGLVAVAAQAGIDRIGLYEAWRLAGVRIVASDTFALGTRMRHFCLIDFFSLLGMAGDAECLGVGLRQHDFTVCRGLVAAVASVHRERRMSESPDEFGRARLV